MNKRRCISGVRCSSLNVDANVNSTSVTFDTYVNVSCQVGYQFTDNQTWLISRCQEDRSWSLQPTNCSRKGRTLTDTACWFTFISVFPVVKKETAIFQARTRYNKKNCRAKKEYSAGDKQLWQAYS